MTEASLWTTARRHLGPYGRLVRVENRADPGTPDVYYRIGRAAGWVELKHLDAAPSRITTPVRVPHFTGEQVSWIEAEYAAGGRAYLLIQIGRVYAVFAAPVVRQIKTGMNMSELRLAAGAWSATGFPTTEILQCLVK